MFEALLAAVAVALVSLIGVLFFGNHKGLVGSERYVVPIAVGVFMSLVLYELIPETLLQQPVWGGIAVAFGFISFYVLAQVLHGYFHRLGEEDCDRKGAAMLLLVGDGIHNFADGIVLGGAFLIDPSVGIVTAVALALHEIPQEIVEFGVLLRAGYTKRQAALRNLLSASSIILGTFVVMLLAGFAEDWIWLATGIAAGNLLFLAASDLLPRIHGNLKNYGSIWHATTAIVLGFIAMTVVIQYAHSAMPHHDHSQHTEEIHSADDDHENHEDHDDDSH